MQGGDSGQGIFNHTVPRSQYTFRKPTLKIVFAIFHPVDMIVIAYPFSTVLRIVARKVIYCAILRRFDDFYVGIVVFPHCRSRYTEVVGEIFINESVYVQIYVPHQFSAYVSIQFLEAGRIAFHIRIRLIVDGNICVRQGFYILIIACHCFYRIRGIEHIIIARRIEPEGQRFARRCRYPVVNVRLGPAILRVGKG